MKYYLLLLLLLVFVSACQEGTTVDKTSNSIVTSPSFPEENASEDNESLASENDFGFVS